MESIKNQSYNCNYEIIIIDDDPNFDDNSNLKMIKKLHLNNIVYYKNKKNLGIYNNMNMGSLLASSNWLCFLHDDDLIEENFLKEIFFILQNKKNIYLLDNRIKLLDMRNIKKNKMYIAKNYIKNKLYNNGKLLKLDYLDFYYYADIGGVGTIVNKNIFIDLGGFNNEYYPSSDYYLWIDIFLHGKNNMYIYNKQLSIRRFEENESLKLEVVEEFIQNDFILKGNLAKNSKFLKEIRKYLLIRNIKIWKKEWNIKVNLDKIGDNLKIKLDNINYIDILISKIIGLYFICRRIKKIFL